MLDFERDMIRSFCADVWAFVELYFGYIAWLIVAAILALLVFEVFGGKP